MFLKNFFHPVWGKAAFENRMLTGKWEEGNGYTVKIVMNRNISVCVFRKLILKVQYCIYLDIPFFTL